MRIAIIINVDFIFRNFITDLRNFDDVYSIVRASIVRCSELNDSLFQVKGLALIRQNSYYEDSEESCFNLSLAWYYFLIIDVVDSIDLLDFMEAYLGAYQLEAWPIPLNFKGA